MLQEAAAWLLGGQPAWGPCGARSAPANRSLTLHCFQLLTANALPVSHSGNCREEKHEGAGSHVDVGRMLVTGLCGRHGPQLVRQAGPLGAGGFSPTAVLGYVLQVVVGLLARLPPAQDPPARLQMAGIAFPRCRAPSLPMRPCRVIWRRWEQGWR